MANSALTLTLPTTPVPVSQGGTAASSLTAYAVMCGGTTSTGAVQSIASVGTSGQVLTSNGAGALPTFQAAAAGGVGSVVQVVTAQTQTKASTATTIPGDATIPQNTEGAELLTATITPTNSSNKLIISFSAPFGTSSDLITVAVFQDSTANALASYSGYVISGVMEIISGEYVKTAGTTSATTFKIRYGANSSTCYALQETTGDDRGGTTTAVLKITEVKV